MAAPVLPLSIKGLEVKIAGAQRWLEAAATRGGKKGEAGTAEGGAIRYNVGKFVF